MLLVLAALTAPASAPAAGDINTARCSAASEASDGFRTTLPDCRAYELVTPPFKYGLPPLNSGFFLAEGALTFSSIGGFAEAEQNTTGLGSTYLAARAPGGWQTTALDLPAGEFGTGTGINGEERLLDVSQSMNAVLSVDTPASAKATDDRFYKRTLAAPGSCPAGATSVQDGCAVEVGRVLSPEAVERANPVGQHPAVAYSGASHNLSQVFFSLVPFAAGAEWRWPGDTSVANSSLYQLSGTNDTEPKLVAVKNQHALASDREAEPIGQCGSVLGGQLGTSTPVAPRDTSNAISEDGSRVFFTVEQGGCPSTAPGAGEHTGEGPAVAEIYVRIEGSSTLAISEPPLTVPGRVCTGACEEAEINPAKRSEGIYQGASSDGSKVFFITAQPLLNSDESGTGTGPDLYEAELAGAGQATKVTSLTQVSHNTLGSEPADVLGVAAISPDASRVYYVAHGILAANHDARGETPTAGADNLYLSEPDPANPAHARTLFIAKLGEADSAVWEEHQAETTPPTATTSDGQFLLLSSTADLTSDAKGEGNQIYRYDAQSEQLTRISVGQCPPPADTCSPAERFNASLEGRNFTLELQNKTALAGAQRVAISNDGSDIVFESASALTPDAEEERTVACEEPEENGECPAPVHAINVYEYHAGNTYLISDGQDSHATLSHSTTRLLGMSPSGRDIYLSSGDQLVPQDTDTQEDIYDARIEGGYPAPPQTAKCAGEACLGPPAQAPQLQANATTAFSGPGNTAASPSNPPAPPTRPKPQTKLQRALAQCRRLHNRSRRRRCEAQARKRYATKHKPSHRSHR